MHVGRKNWLKLLQMQNLLHSFCSPVHRLIIEEIFFLFFGGVKTICVGQRENWSLKNICTHVEHYAVFATFNSETTIGQSLLSHLLVTLFCHVYYSFLSRLLVTTFCHDHWLTPLVTSISDSFFVTFIKSILDY